MIKKKKESKNDIDAGKETKDLAVSTLKYVCVYICVCEQHSMCAHSILYLF